MLRSRLPSSCQWRRPLFGADRREVQGRRILYVCVCRYVYIGVYVCRHAGRDVPMQICTYITTHLSISPSGYHLLLCLSIYSNPTICLSVYLCTYLHMYLSTYRSIYRPSMNLYIFLSACLSIYLPIYPCKHVHIHLCMFVLHRCSVI